MSVLNSLAPKAAMKEFILDLNELERLCKALPNEGIVLLKGDLGSGKTSLVQALARFKGIEESVSSPTFSIMQEYENESGFKIFHYDIYQNGTKSLLENGLFENFFERGLHLVEWGDEALKEHLQGLGLDVLSLEIWPLEHKRKYILG